MDTIFINSENSRTSEYHILEVKKVLLYQILVFTIHGKAHTRIIN